MGARTSRLIILALLLALVACGQEASKNPVAYESGPLNAGTAVSTYLVVRSVYRGYEQPMDPDVAKDLNRYWSEGWRLVTVVPLIHNGGRTAYQDWIFERR